MLGRKRQAKNINRVYNIVRKVDRIMGTEREGLERVYNKACERKSRKILSNLGHPLNECFMDSIIPRSGRMRLATATTNRYQRPFVPRAMKMYNNLSV